MLTVYYTEQTYTVEASIVAENADNEPGGTITPTRETVNKGGDQAVTWTIDEGYEIVKVEVDGSVVSLDKNSYDFYQHQCEPHGEGDDRPIEYSVVFQRGESGKLGKEATTRTPIGSGDWWIRSRAGFWARTRCPA